MTAKTRRLLGLTLLLAALFAQTALAGWTKSGSSYIYTDASGAKRTGTYYAAQKLGFVKIGSYWYCFTSGDQQKTGWVSIGSSKYYFKPSNGRQLRNKTAKIGKKYYRFAKNGKMLRSGWYKGYYYGKNGARLVSATKKLSGVTYTFDASGNAAGKTASGTSVVPEYVSDPKASDETLLSAIIYLEAGNQPYYGKLAVGLVVTNRKRSPLFPSTIREVLYQSQQFYPAGSTHLGNLLKKPDSIPASCKKAAKEVLSMYKKNTYKIQKGKKTVNMKGYLFFMTPAAFKSLGLETKYLQLKGHVFFKTWA